MKRRALTGFAGAAVAAALLAPAGPAGADPQATAAGEEVVRYLTKGKLKVAKTIKYSFVCGVTCNVKVDVTLVLPGPNFTPPAVTGA
ncbi:MAG: hypothetical protein M3O25_12540, partial [Actinomycetota bacterium]|nr:hypothetical protein [Actinomycetota bacterium]